MTEQESIKEVKRWTSILMSAGSKCVSDTAEAQRMAIKALEEIQKYREIGAVSELQDLVIGINALADSQFSAADMAKLVNDMKSLYEYQQIGTPEECRAAVEKQKAKKPKEYEDKFYACATCGNVLLHKWEKYPTKLMDKKNGLPYCLGCGQELDWSDEE